MPTNTIFISYSRKDSEYMTEFSQKLRDAGANLWSDKQIVPGIFWDNSIETALKTCDVIIVLISQASVKSNNVMDEVSYALEENKKVIPLVIEQCDLPFRLRRIQFIDLTKNSEKGMNLLKSTLNLTSAPKPVSNIGVKSSFEPKKVSETKIEKEIHKEAPIIPKKPTETLKIPPIKPVQPKEKFNKNILKFAVPVVLLVIAYFVYPLFTNNEKPIVDNDDKIRSINPVVIKETIAKKDTITEIKEPIITKTDASEWELVKVSNNITEFENHMNTFSDCSHVEEATTIINDLKLIKEEDELFNSAKTSIELLNYMMKYGKQGTYYSEALETLDTFFTSSGFVQFSASNGVLYFSIFENETGKIPEVGDLIFAKGQRNSHLGPLNSSKYSTINHTTSKDEVFKVKEVNKLGAAYWVKVAF